ncbi:MAG: hypothetical protein N3F05_00905 [Candidatus Diapherotrites archaeon]|nr:hypothetical protein [Candidatus Diapherotrites archaeon]
MGFLKNIIGFFFRQKKKVAKIGINEAKKMLNEERLKKSIRKELQSIISDIKIDVAEARATFVELEKELPDIEDGPFKKIVQTSKKGFINSIRPLLDKLEPPLESDVIKIKEYYEAASAAIQKSVFRSRRNIAYASAGVPKSMYEIGRRLDSISSKLNALGKIIEENGLLFSNTIDSKILDVENSQQKIVVLESRLKELEEKRKVIEEHIGSLRSQLNTLLDSEQAKKALSLQEEMEKLQKRKVEIKEHLVGDFLSVGRLLKKFYSICKKGNYEINHEKMKNIEKIIKDLDTALKSDPKGNTIKEVLGELKNAVEVGTLKLDDKEKKQQLPIIEKLLKEDFFGEYFWPINEIDARILQIEKELRNNKIGLQISQHKGEISRAERDLKDILLEIDKTRDNILTSNKEFESKKAELSKMLSTIFGYEITLR